MVICIGEILADMQGHTCNEHMEFACFAGGAPFNVACCLKKLGIDTGFCGSVGYDTIGDFLIDIVKKQQFNYSYIQRDKERNTTLAFVEVDSMGERKFSFYRKNTADAYLPHELIEQIVCLADIIHIGSLPLSSADGCAFVDELIAFAHNCNKKISFDVNYRSDIFSSEGEAIELYRKYIEEADIVKFSEEELLMFIDGKSVEERLCRLAGKHKMVLLTLGSQGSVTFHTLVVNHVVVISDLFKYGNFDFFSVKRIYVRHYSIFFHISPHITLLMPPPNERIPIVPNSEQQSSVLFQT